jgi:type VI protein secretion system component Hcp
MFVRTKFGLCLVILVGLINAPPLSAEGYLCFGPPISAQCDLTLSELEGCIEIVGFNEQVISEAGTATTYFGPLKVIKRIDETTPRLFAKAGSGVPKPGFLSDDKSGLNSVNVVLIGDRGDAAYVRYAVIFENAQITSISQTGGEGEPLEQVEFTPLWKVIWTYQPLDETGACLPIVEGLAELTELP